MSTVWPAKHTLNITALRAYNSIFIFNQILISIIRHILAKF